MPNDIYLRLQQLSWHVLINIVGGGAISFIISTNTAH